MPLMRSVKRRLQAAVAPMIFLALTGYFGWSATQGAHGLRGYAERTALLDKARGEQARAEADRDALERRVAGLRASHIAADTLDERARAMLNLSDPGDVMVQYAPKDRLFP